MAICPSHIVAGLCTALVPGAALAADSAVPAPAEVLGIDEQGEVPEKYAFAIMRNGDRIGEHHISFEQDDDRLKVMVRIEIDVSFGPIPVYTYDHTNQEIWQDGQLVSINTSTTENGDEFTVSGQATPEGFTVDGMEGEKVLAADIIPTSYWNKDIVRADTLLDSQRGTVIEINAAEMSRNDEIGADCYDLRGDLDVTLCYDGERLRKLAFRFEGSYIEYQPLNTES